MLLNILIALFNQAYSIITGEFFHTIAKSDNAIDEFLALFSYNTLEYIRAPDENVFCPPLNLIEAIFLVPLEPFLSHDTYQRVAESVMKVVYFPVLCLIAWYESRCVTIILGT